MQIKQNKKTKQVYRKETQLGKKMKRICPKSLARTCKIERPPDQTLVAGGLDFLIKNFSCLFSIDLKQQTIVAANLEIFLDLKRF